MNQPKIFPVFGPDFYTKSYQKTPYQKLMKVALRGEKILTNRQLSTGWRLTDKQKLLRVFHLHKLAVTAEIEMKVRSADFFWNLCYQQFDKLLKQAALWKELEDALALDTSLKDAIIKEVFISSHIALCNGYLVKGNTGVFGERAIAQLDLTDKLTKHYFDPECYSDHAFYLKQLAWFKIKIYDALKRPDKTIQACETIVSRSDSFFCNTLINAIYDKALKNYQSGKDQLNAQNLEQSIKKLESFAVAAERIDIFYYRLGDLYFYHGIALANSKKLSKALLSVRKAYAYNPYIKNVDQTWSTLEKQMVDLQKDISELLLSIRGTNKQLTAEGYKMKAEADKGFILVNQFIDKDEKTILSKRRIAYLQRLLYDIGIDEAAGENWIANAEYISGVVNKLFQAEGGDLTAVRVRWEQLSREDFGMQNMPKEKIIRYVVDYNNGIASYRDAEKIRLLENKEMSDLKIVPEKDAVSKREAPLVYWMASTQDIVAKMVAAAAIIVVLATAFLAIEKSYKDRKRDIAFAELTKSMNKQTSHQARLDNAADFLDNLPTLGADARTSGVISIYQAELARWFMEEDHVSDQQFSAYMKRLKNAPVQSPEKTASL